MYADKTLTPREAIRLCALGTLAEHSVEAETVMTYDELAYAIRHFVSHITGPSLELMGESIELLRFEGLVATKDNSNSSNPILIITSEGIKLLKELLCANIRPGSNDLNELIIALKFRFLKHLDPSEQASQINLILDACESELARNEDLRNHYKNDEGYIAGWLENNIKQLKIRIAWLKDFELNIRERHNLLDRY